MRYNHYSMLPEKAFQPVGKRMTLEGGDDPAPAQPTQSTAYNTNIPEYAKPYVTNMLEATQKQLFNMNGDSITGFKPYTPYSNNPQDYVAGFSPMQQQAQSGVANLQLPGQYQAGSQLAGASGLGALGVAGQASQAGNNYNRMATNPYSMGQFMNPYIQQSLQPQLNMLQQQGNIQANQAQGQATSAGAFGGTRGQLASNLAQQNSLMAQQSAIGQGYNQAFQQAQQAQQFGANLGLQGQQAALQGYGQAGQAGATLGQLGQQQLSGQEGILSAQAQMGKTQQDQQQGIINQQIQNYATAQQYPMMQLGMMSNMLRGLPMQAVTTQAYQAQPSALNQGIGALGAAAGAYKAFGAKGGLPKDFEIKKYSVGGKIEAQLAQMDDAQLKQVAQTSSSKEIREMAVQLLVEHQMAEKAQQQVQQQQPQPQGLAAVPQQPQPQPSPGLAAAQSNLPTQMAGGGIIAFGDPELNPNEDQLVTNPGDRQLAPTSIAMAENPFAKTPELALDKYRKMLGRPEEDEYKKYGEALAAKQADMAKTKEQNMGLNMMDFFSNFGTQIGSPIQAGLKSWQNTGKGITARNEALDKEDLGYIKADADIARAKRLELEGDVKAANDLFIKGEETKDKVDIANINKAKLKAPTMFTQIKEGALALILAQHPEYKNDPIALAKATNEANIIAANKIAEAQIAKVGVAQQVANTGAKTAADTEIAKTKAGDLADRKEIDDKYKKVNENTLVDLQDANRKLNNEISKPESEQNSKTIVKYQKQIKGYENILKKSRADITAEVMGRSTAPSTPKPSAEYIKSMHAQYVLAWDAAKGNPAKQKELTAYARSIGIAK